jgi:GT2 family glycosyltransferase
VKGQAYARWELVLVDDCSRDPELTALLQSFADEDRRIKVRTLAANGGIAIATNAALEMCRGEYVAFLDHDDELSADSLYRVVEMLNADPSLDVLYSDEDKIDENGRHTDGFFKPDWSPDLLRSMNYVCHFLVVRRSLLQTVGGLRLGFDGSQDYDLILRLCEQSQKIRRVPHILYHWRMHEQSTASGVDRKPAASDAGRQALEQHLSRNGVLGTVEEIGPCRYRVRYNIEGYPEVSIVIPTGGSETLTAALRSILKVTTYKNYSIVIVDNSSGRTVEKRVREFQGEAHTVKLLDCRYIPFNFSFLCNRGAEATRAPFLLFVNDDTSVISPDWIEAMLEHAQREEIGAVGAQLLFPNDTLQHVGVVTGLVGVAGHPFRGSPDALQYFGLSHVIRNCSAVTGACLMVRRNVFEAVSRFDEVNLPTCFQDVDLCLKMLERGYRVVYTPFARLYHYESYSKKAVAHAPEITYMDERWSKAIADDPYYNPNLTRRADDYSLSYDRVFAASKSHESTKDARSADSTAGKAFLDHSQIETSAAIKLRPYGKIEFRASPNPARPARGGLGETVLTWTAPGAKKVQVRVGSPWGPLFTEGGSSGSAATGPWVESGTAFYLLDATAGDAATPEHVLALVRVTVTPTTQHGMRAHTKAQHA